MIPQRVYIETYGCSFNAADGEAMAGVLLAEGFDLAAGAADADAVILNTCTVKDRTYLNFEKRFAELRRGSGTGFKEAPAVVLAGCIPKANRGDAALEGIAAIGPDTIGSIGEVVRAAIAGRPLRRLNAPRGEAAGARATLPARRRNPAVEILPISSGCLSACTFCQTRLARGRLVSFRPGDLLERARRAIGDGVTQLWVTSQDTGAYGKDCGGSLVELLIRLCEIEGDFRIRLGMTSPIWIWQDLQPILKVLEHPRMFKFLHVPAQSGSDAVLAAMKRGNTARQFMDVAQGFNARFPDATLMTDIIAGFPTETDEDFAATLAMIGQARPVAVNRSRFSARPGTAAALIPPLPDRVLSERCLMLNDLVPKIAAEYHRRQVGKTEPVLTGEVKVDGTTLAYNAAWRPVVLPGRHKLGQWLTARYVLARDYHLLGEVVPPSSVVSRK